MGIKKNKNGKWDVLYSARDPLTRKPKTLKRIDIATEAEAKRVRDELMMLVQKSFKEKSGGQMRLADLKNRFYESLQSRDLAPATIENYVNCLEAHTKPWNNRAIETMRPEEIRNLIKVTLAQRSQSHQKSMHKFLKGLFNYAVECGFIQRSPVPLLQFRMGDKIKKVLTIEQMKLLLDKAFEMDHQWYPIWASALYLGCRNGELYALTRDKVDLENRRALVSASWDHKHGFKDSTKSKQDRTVEIPEALVPILKKQYAMEPESPYVLPHLDDWTAGRQAEVLRTFLMGIGLPPVRFHDLRASWATALLGRGVEPAKVMIAGGWSDLKTMQIYMRKAGISIQGMTDGFCLHQPSRTTASVTSIYGAR